MSSSVVSFNHHLLDFAQLVQNSNMSNCHHASAKIIRDTNRAAVNHPEALGNPVLVCNKSTQLVEILMRLRSVECNTGEEVKIKRHCIEVLGAMRHICEHGTQPLPNQLEPEVTAEFQLARSAL